MRASILIFCLIFAPLALSGQESTCHAEVPCPLGDRSYHVKEPDDWDGVTPLPVLLHFHGWQRQGTLIVKHKRISGATRRRGVLLLAPNGRYKTWDFWEAGSEDVRFARAVLEDAAKRYPIDREKIFVSGYSYGSAMAWRFVCEDGGDIRSLLAVSGTLDQGETCETLPEQIRHVHGTSDTVMDFPFGPGDDTTFPVSLWRRHFNCSEDVQTSQWQGTANQFVRSEWTKCDDNRSVILDVHKGGHFIPKGWIARQLDQLLADPSG